MNILKIGVTGSAGSGKSHVCKRFKSLGLVTFDCDLISRQVVVPGQKAYGRIIELFGRDVLRADKTLDRSKLRNMMVSDAGLRKQLEAILHPIIIEELFVQINAAVYEDEPACAVEVPLLFELGMEKKFDVVVSVVAEDGELLDRIASRDNVSRKSAARILNLQIAQAEKVKRSDYVIENSKTIHELYERVEKVYAKIKKNS